MKHGQQSVIVDLGGPSLGYVGVRDPKHPSDINGCTRPNGQWSSFGL